MACHVDFCARLAVVASTATALVICLAGCSTSVSRDDHPENEIRSSAVTTAQTLSLSFPAGASRDAVGIGANGALRLNDRVITRTASAAPGAVSNAGATTTTVGADASTGDLTSVSAVVLRNRAKVSGNLRTADTLSLQAGASVTGVATQNTTLTPLNVFSWTVQVPPANAGNVLLAPDVIQDLAPGAYANVTVNSRAQLRLSSGTYFINALTVESQGQLVLDKSKGAIIVYVVNNLIYRGQIISTGGPEGNFLIAFLGTNAVFIEQPFVGTIAAPNASLTLATAAAGHRGTFYARDVEVHQSTTVTAVPFDWTQIVPPGGTIGSLPSDPVNPPQIPAGPFGTRLTPTSFPRAFPRTPYRPAVPVLGAGASSVGAGAPAPDPQGVISPGGVDNISWSLTHEALDYVTPESALGDDSTGRLTGLVLRRFYRPAMSGEVSSFGLGMFSNFDTKLRVVSNSAGGVNIVSFQLTNDLNEVTWTEIDGDAGDNAIDGVFHTSTGVGQSITLLTAANTPTPNPLNAATAVLTEWNGNRIVFEIVNTGVDVRSGRLLGVADPNNNVVAVAYLFAANATLAELGNDRTRLWQIATVTDHYGLVGSFDYAPAKVNDRWVVSAFHAPNGTTITYAYDGTQVLGGIVGPSLRQVNLPDGSASTFTTSVEGSTNLAIVHINDRAAAPGFMVRDVYLSQSQIRTASGALLDQQPNLVRQILNGAGEIMYANWDDPARNGTTYVYEGGGALTRISLDNGSPAAFARASFFNPNLPPSQATFQDVESYQTDSLGRIVAKTDAAGRSTAWERDRLTLAVKSLTYPDGSRQARTFGDFLRLGSLIDRNGNVNQYSYDLRGNLQSAVVGVGQAIQSSSSFVVNARGLTTRVTDPRGNVTDYAYDARGFLLSVTEPPDVAGGPRAVTRYEYDPAGRMTAMIDPAGLRKAFSYDARNRVTRTVYPDGSSETSTFGGGASAGLLVRSTDRNGNITDLSYDGATRLVQSREGVGTPALVVNSKAYLSGTIHALTETRRGERVDYGYDAKGRVVAVTAHSTVSRTLVTQTTFDALSRPITVTDAYGRRTFNFYDADNRLVRQVKELIVGGVAGDPGALTRTLVANPPYTIEDHFFSTMGDETLVIDKVGTATRSDYDSRRRLTRKVEASGTNAEAVWAYEYDVNGNLTRMFRPRASSEEINSVVDYTYNGRNLLSSVTQAPGAGIQSQMTVTYTATQKKATITDARGGVTRYTYSDCCDRLETVTEPTGATTRFLYDPNGNRLAVVDGNGNVNQSSYDALNRPTRIVNGANEATTIVYDDNLTDRVGLETVIDVSGLDLGAGADGTAVQVTDARGARRFLVQDGLGRAVLERDETGNVSRYGYDVIAGGLVEASRTDPLGHVIKNQTDGAGKPRAIIDPEGKVATSTFDAAGRMLSTLDPTGVGRTCLLDVLGRPRACADTHGDVIATTYDTENNPIATTDALGAVSRCTYDALNRPSACTDRLGKVRSFAYDAASNPTAVTDADGSRTTYAYDPRGLRTEERYADGSVIRHEYDAAARLAATIAADGVRITQVYDAANRLIRRDYPDGLSDRYSYDAASRLVQAISDRYQNTVTRSYDAAGRLLTDSLTVAGITRTVTNGYDANGRRTSLTYPDGTTIATSYTARDLVASVQQGSFTFASYTYDDAGRVLRNALGNGKTETYTYRADGLPSSIAIPTVATLSYEFNPAKHVTRESRDGQVFEQFTYDAEQRLTAWTRGGLSNAWTLSGEGDFLTVFRNGTPIEARSHDATHAVVDINETPLSYDRRGRLLRDREGRTYDWSPDGNLAGATRGDARVTYAYDAVGRRVSRQADSVTTVFVHDESQVVAEYDNGALARTYLLGLRLDQPIAMRLGTVTYYYSRQFNGSIHALVKDTGQVVERYEYDPHGVRTVRAPDGTVRATSAFGNAYGFTGRHHDEAIGIIDFRSRHYSPELGRFLSRDVAYLDGLSLYRAYFTPDASDPTGQFSLNPVKAFKAVVHATASVGKAVVNTAGAVVHAAADGLSAAGDAAAGTVATVTHAAVGAFDTVAGAVTSAASALPVVGPAIRAVNNVLGTAVHATATLGIAVVQGVNQFNKAAIQTATVVADESSRLAKGVISATADAATLVADTAGAVSDAVTTAAIDTGKFLATTSWSIGKWAAHQAWNVGKGMVLEAYNLSKRGLEELWDLSKSAGSLAWWFVSTPYAFVKDPEAWAKSGLAAGWDFLKNGASTALWTTFELAPTLIGSVNSFGPLTAFGVTLGVIGWIAGGDAPTLNWAGGGIVFEFGHSPVSFGGSAFSRTYGRAIIYGADPARDRNHEFQHVTQYNVFGDVGYVIAHGASIGISYATTNSYDGANLLERGPYGIGGPQRPWPWSF